MNEKNNKISRQQSKPLPETSMSSHPAAEGKRIKNRLNQLQDQFTPGTQGVPNQVAAQYYERDPRDDYVEAKREIARAPEKGFGTVVPVTEKDIEYVLDQRSKEEKLQFDRWKYSTFLPGSDPLLLKYYRKVDPDFFSSREAEIDKICNIIRRLAKLVLHGPENEEDLVLIYGLQSGQVGIPNWKALFPANFVGDKSVLATATPLQQGFFNPRKIRKTPAPAYDLTNGQALTFPTAAANNTYGNMGQFMVDKLQNTIYK